MNATTHTEYEFTNDWFVQNTATWNAILPQYAPQKFLEIGSFEGRSTCYLIEKFAALSPIELHCVDTWAGGIEHGHENMSEVEMRFDRNVERARAKVAHPVTLVKHKKSSSLALAAILAAGRERYFDFVYVDGSHQASDVLSDCILSFHLLHKGGVMVFDDYLWSMHQAGEQDMFQMPKPAIDAFLNIFQRKMQIVAGVPIYQLFATKTRN